mgnify:CR=1 FL=1
MNHVTSIGLDVHARSVTAVAFDPWTGEVVSKKFNYVPSEIASWVLGFESPKVVYESGVTGFHLVRELRALNIDCIIGAVSKMQKPAADKRKKNDRNDAEFLARQLAARNVTEVWVPDEECDLDYIPKMAREKQAVYALSNSLGFGGQNAALLLKHWEE